jgi:AraC family transcriptional activator of pobA
MKKQETVEEFYKDRGNIQEVTGQFNVFEREAYSSKPMSYNRRDFYKVALLHGTSKLIFADRDIEINSPALVFSNPLTPYAWEPISKEQPGYFCLFNEEFLKENDRTESLQNSPLFKIGSNPVFFLNEVQVEYISDIFRKMLAEIDTDYIYKYDLLRNYLNLIIHEALKMQPNETSFKHKNASKRIASLFLELLERQFPIDTPQHALKLKTASDYAKALAVHVNHLNHAVRKVTGKSTTVHISDRILTEAKALLKHTDWSVSEIAFSLGFEYRTYFNNFFKKKTGLTPKLVRE